MAAMTAATPDQPHLRKVARGGFYALAGSMVTAAATFGFTVIATRSLPSQADAGTLFALTSAYVVVAAVVRLGAPTGLVYFLNRYRSTDRMAKLRLVWRVAYTPVVFTGGVIGIVGFVSAPWLANALVGRSDSATITLVRVLAILVVFSALKDMAVSTTRGYGAMRPVVLVEKIARPAGQIALALVTVVLGAKSVLTLGMAWAVPFPFAALVLILWARRIHAELAGYPISYRRKRFTQFREEQRTFWRFTMPRSIGGVAQMALQRTDIVMLGVLAGPASAALYTAATRFLVVGQLSGQALNLAMQSKIASLVARDDWPGVRQVYAAATRWGLLLTWPAYLTFVVYSTDLLKIFGSGYTESAHVIVILCLTMLVATAVGAVDTLLVMAGRTSWTMLNALAALLVNIGLNVLLIPEYGITGAAVSWSAAITVKNLVPFLQLAVIMRLHPFDRLLASVMALPVTCFLLAPWATAQLFGGPFGGHLAGSVIGCLLYAGALWTWRRPLSLTAFTAIRRKRTSS